MFFNQIGYQALYLVQQLIVQEEQKELAFSMLPDSFLEKIRDNDQIKWEEEGKEFYMNGNMYDVVKTRVIHGEKIFFVVNDKRESELLKKFSNIIRSQHENTQNKKSGGLEIKFQTSVFTLAISNDPFINFDAIHAYQIIHEKAANSFFAEILVPPPQC